MITAWFIIGFIAAIVAYPLFYPYLKESQFKLIISSAIVISIFTVCGAISAFFVGAFWLSKILNKGE